MKYQLVAITLTLGLAACGGGGGGGSSAGGSVAPPPAPQAKIQQVATQRAVAEQSLQSIQAARDTYSFGAGGPKTASTLRHIIESGARSVSATYRTTATTDLRPRGVTPDVAYGPCTNNAESAQVNISSNEAYLYARLFYDSACTQLYHDLFLDVIATSSTAGTLTGNETSYTTSGSVFEYNTLALSITGVGTGSGTFSLLVTDSASATSAELARVGVACNVTTALGCGFGALEHSASLNQDAGVTLGLNVSVVSSSSSGTTIGIGATANAYTGGLNALSMTPAAFPAWAINGGTLADTASMNGQLAFNQLGVVTSGTLSLTDAADDGSATMTGNSTGITGTIIQTSTGATIATISVDPNGNGTVSYSGGATGQVVNWQVVS